MQEDKDRLDLLIDSALASYTSRSAPLGLEARVLRRIRTEGVGPGWPVWRWILVAAACCLLAGLAVWIRRAPAPAPVVQRSAVSKPPVPTLQRRRAHPTASALTPQERALLTFVNDAPEQVLQMSGPMQPLEIEPLSIDMLDVQPLPDQPFGE